MIIMGVGEEGREFTARTSFLSTISWHKSYFNSKIYLQELSYVKKYGGIITIEE